MIAPRRPTCANCQRSADEATVEHDAARKAVTLIVRCHGQVARLGMTTREYEAGLGDEWSAFVGAR